MQCESRHCHHAGERGLAAEVVADRFAKFTIVADPAPLWRRAAEELAQHAAQVRGIPRKLFSSQHR